MARRASAHDLLLQLQARGLSQKKIADRLGVHPRTIRKWKSGETSPSDAHYAKAQRAASKARSENRALARRQTRGRQPIPRDVPIPSSERRTLRTYRGGKWTGGYELSDWVNYNVRGWSNADVLDFIEALRERGAAMRMKIQLIYLAPVESPTDSGTPYSSTQQRSGSAITDVGGRDAAGLRQYFSKLIEGKRRRPLYVAVLDT